MKTSQERSQARRRRVRSAGVGLGLVLLLAILVALAVLPWAMGFVAAAQHGFLERIPQNSPGAYLLTEQGAMPLYDWYMPIAKLPPDAVALATTSLRSLVIVGEPSHPPAAYILYDLGRQHPVGWQSMQREDRQLFLQPPALAPGDYLLIVPTDDVLGGNRYHYFRLY